MRWDLIDHFERIRKHRDARAWKSFSGDEDFFEEHEPSEPRVPEPLYIEMIAQVGGVLFGFGWAFKKEVILAKIEEAFFDRAMAPPARFCVEARIEEEREEGAWISGEVLSQGLLVAKARIMLVTMDSLSHDAEKKVVFNDKFLAHYDIWNVAKRSEAVKV